MKKTLPIIFVVIIVIALAYWLSLSPKSEPLDTNPSPSANTPANTKSDEAPAVLPYNDDKNDVPLSSRTSATLGEYLTDSKGFTLYTYKKDGVQKSNCNTACLANWPAFLSYGDIKLETYTDTLTKQVNITERVDGKAQLSFGPNPLYYYKGDLEAGDTNGQGMDGGNWSVVKLGQ